MCGFCAGFFRPYSPRGVTGCAIILVTLAAIHIRVARLSRVGAQRDINWILAKILGKVRDYFGGVCGAIIRDNSHSIIFIRYILFLNNMIISCFHGWGIGLIFGAC